MEAKHVVPLVAVCMVLAACALAPISRVSAGELTVGGQGQYRTISAAIKAANAGDTILVGPGTYAENVVVDKPITVVSTKGAQATVVQAASTSKGVFVLSGNDISIQGLTITGGQMGVEFGHVSNCMLTKCILKGNVFAVYLTGASSNLVSNNNLNNNHYGMYLDGSSGNKLSSNSAMYEQGGGGEASLSDGIYLYHSNNNNVSGCDLSNNINFGASFYGSKNNVFSNNTFSSNAQFAVRLRDSSDNNKFSYNTFKANVENGVLIANSRGNTFYFNNFVDEKSHFYSQEDNNINSTKKLNYTYNGESFSGFVGNYYSDYKGVDKDRNGIGDSSFAGDKYPLIKPIVNYGQVQPSPSPSPASQTSNASANMTAATAGHNAPVVLPGFETVEAIFGLLCAAVVAAILNRRGS